MAYSEGELPAGVVVLTLDSASEAGVRPAFKGRPTAPAADEEPQDIFVLGSRSILEEAVRSIPDAVLANLRGFQITVLA
jgi:hypothetical protein